jgi:hypothetical protein
MTAHETFNSTFVTKMGKNYLTTILKRTGTGMGTGDIFTIDNSYQAKFDENFKKKEIENIVHRQKGIVPTLINGLVDRPRFDTSPNTTSYLGKGLCRSFADLSQGKSEPMRDASSQGELAKSGCVDPKKKSGLQNVQQKIADIFKSIYDNNKMLERDVAGEAERQKIMGQVSRVILGQGLEGSPNKVGKLDGMTESDAQEASLDLNDVIGHRLPIKSADISLGSEGDSTKTECVLKHVINS